MKFFLNKERKLQKSFLLLIFLFSPFFAIAEKSDFVRVQSLDEETREFLCVSSTSSLEAEDICLTDNLLSVEKLAICALYTSTVVSEVLCLKNRLLSSADILKCFVDTPEFIEQTCLVKSGVSDRITSHYFETNGEILPNILEEMENIEKEMTALSGYEMSFDVTQGFFYLSTPSFSHIDQEI